MQKLRVVCLSLLLILFSLSFALGQEWQTLHHGEGVLVDIASSADGQRLLVETRPGGFYLSQDGGATWAAINERITPSYPYTFDGLSTLGPAADTLIAHTHSANEPSFTGAYVSYDGGTSWAGVNFDDLSTPYLTSSMQVAMLRAPSERMYMAEPNVFARSDDGGQTWIANENQYWQVSDGVVRGILVHPQNPDTVFVHGSWDAAFDFPSGGILRTINAGDHFLRVAHMEDLSEADWGMVNDLVIFPDGSLLAVISAPYIGMDYPFLLRSEDDGVTWEHVATSGLPVNHAWKTICVVPEIPGRVFLAGMQGGLWQSDDGGETWHRVFNGLPPQPMRSECIYRNEFSGDLYFVTFGMGIWKSTDHGNSWQAVNSPPVGTHEVESLLATEHGIWHSGLDGSLWFAEGDALDFSPVERIGSADQFESIRAIDFPDSRLGYIRSLHNIYTNDDLISVAVSQDGGATWSEGSPTLFPDSSGFTSVATLHSGDDLLLVGLSNTRYLWHLSNDLGESWTTIPYESNYFMTPPIYHRGQYYSASYEASALFRMDEFGAPMEPLWLPGPLSGVANSGYSLGDTLLVQILNQTYALLPDDSWETRGATQTGFFSYPHDLVELAPTDSDTALVCIDSWVPFRVYTSDDHGYSWEINDFGFPWQYYDQAPWGLEWDPWRQRLWMDAGTELGVLSGFPTDVAEGSPGQPVTHDLLAAYPNPFNAATTVQFALTQPGRIELVVFDALGRQVAELARGSWKAGAHELSFDASSLPSGSYYLRLDTGQTVLTRKLTLVK